jgi:hypothetical protein
MELSLIFLSFQEKVINPLAEFIEMSFPVCLLAASAPAAVWNATAGKSLTAVAEELLSVFLPEAE